MSRKNGIAYLHKLGKVGSNAEDNIVKEEENLGKTILYFYSGLHLWRRGQPCGFRISDRGDGQDLYL